MFDPEPIGLPDMDELIAKLSEEKYFSKIDLAEGYWQIPALGGKTQISFYNICRYLSVQSFHFVVVNAAAVFTRMMTLRGCIKLLIISMVY